MITIATKSKSRKQFQHGVQNWLLLCNRTAAVQSPPSMDFSRQEYWSGLPLPPPGDLPDPGVIPGLLHCRHIPYRLSHQASPPYVCALVWEDELAFCMGGPEVCASVASLVGRRRRSGKVLDLHLCSHGSLPALISSIQWTAAWFLFEARVLWL